jgi:hypothetical protein
VVLLADCNVDVRGEKTRKYMADLSMREVITEFYGDEGPCTYDRGSNKNWASPSNKHKSMKNWMRYQKKESTKHSNSAGNSIQEKKTGRQKPQYWESG